MQKKTLTQFNFRESQVKYPKVQFISWELCTAPVSVPAKPNIPQLFQYYPGICLANDNRMDVLSQCQDIEARLQFFQLALKQAAMAGNIDKSDTTLKVFMAPEFLFRGAGGAYLHDLVNGWQSSPPDYFAMSLQGTKYAGAWNGLFGSLRNIAANDAYKNWIIVPGTTVSASFSCAPKQKPKGQPEPAYIDFGQPAEIYNNCLILLGGSANANISHTTTKHYKSAIDFISNYAYVNQAFLNQSTRPLNDPRLAFLDELQSEGGAIFTLSGVNDASDKPITWGVEVCLDHAVSGGMRDPKSPGSFRNPFGVIRAFNNRVNIQLVPSGGMTLKDASIWLTPVSSNTQFSYAFNCDGSLNLVLPPQANTLPSACHTQIWCGSGSSAVPVVTKLLQLDGRQEIKGTTLNQVPGNCGDSLNKVLATQLWSYGAGNVRVVDPHLL